MPASHHTCDLGVTSEKQLLLIRREIIEWTGHWRGYVNALV